MAVADEVKPPGTARQEVTGQRQGVGEHDQADRQWTGDGQHPVLHCLRPGDEAVEIKGRWHQEAGRVADQQPADLVGQQVERDDGEGVGVERHEQRQRQVDAEQDGAQRCSGHLERPRDQAAEQAGGDRTGCRTAVQVP